MKMMRSHTMGLGKRKSLQGICLCIPTIAGVFVFYLLPFWMALLRSVQQGIGGTFVGLQNYSDLFHNAAFLLAMKNTAIFWGISLPLNLVLGLLIALLCEKLAAHGQQAILFFPAMLPAACVVLPVQTMCPAEALKPNAALWLQAIVFLWKSTGYTVLILAAALHTIPRGIIESAVLCGADSLQVLWYIRLPLILPAVGASVLVAFLNSFKIFRESYLLWGTHPDNKLYGLQHFLHNNFANMNDARVAAASILLVAAIAGFCLIGCWIAKKKGTMSWTE